MHALHIDMTILFEPKSQILKSQTSQVGQTQACTSSLLTTVLLSCGQLPEFKTTPKPASAPNDDLLVRRSQWQVEPAALGANTLS